MRIAIIVSAVVTVILIVVFRDIIAGFVTMAGYIALFAMASSVVVSTLYGISLVAERVQSKRLERRRNKYVEYRDGFGMIHLLNLETDVIENLSVFPGTHHNGHWEEPHPAAAAAWFALVGNAKKESPVNLLPAYTTTTTETQIDLLTVMTQATQSYAIIGGQQVGKTYQARRIANYWLQTGIKPIVVGPKWDRGEWEDCTLFGGEYNLERVAQGMRIVKRLAEDRHSNSQRGHKENPVQPVFFDDWTSIRAKLEKEAEDFIIDATTLYASVNIILYFIIHLDTANAWGVGKVGAALHQNFIKLFIEPGFTESGLIDRGKNTGYILMPGQSKKDRRRVALFSGTGQQAKLPDLVVRLTDEEIRISEMLTQGASRSAIARAIFGSDGGNQLKKVGQIIEKLSP